MKHTFICSDPRHPVYAALRKWQGDSPFAKDLRIVEKAADVQWDGENLFLIACTEIIGPAIRSRFDETIVFHASDLPRGRGWSPYIWEIEAGAEHVTLSMLRAHDKVDAGDIFAKRRIPIPRHALYPEIAAAIANATLALIEQYLTDPAQFEPKPQTDVDTATYYARRKPEHSLLDPSRSLESQFDRIRVCDPVRYPPVVELRGRRYKVTLERIDDGQQSD